MNKRDFLRTVGGAAASALFGPHLPAASGIATGDFWQDMRKRYTLPADRIDLEHGYYSRMADEVAQALVGHVRAVNTDASFYMRKKQWNDRLGVRQLLAELAGCPVTELALTRNTTESLDTVIAGFDWRAGDHAVMAEQDYGTMLDMFAQVCERHGVERTLVSLPNDPGSDEEIVRLYAGAMTARTRLLLVSHVVNITGQVLPVAKIAAMAKEKGVQVLVDGAHSFAQLDFKIPELGCDYYGASLHKWLGAPLGSGLLWVRQDRQAGLWPLLGNGHGKGTIERLNHTGTHPAHTDLAIATAIALHREIGGRRKEERLRWLQRYWTEQVRGMAGVRLCTPSAAERTCAIATVGVDGVAPGELEKRLLLEFGIAVVAIERPGVSGVRVTPAVYTTVEELDALVGALRKIAGG